MFREQKNEVKVKVKGVFSILTVNVLKIFKYVLKDKRNGNHIFCIKIWFGVLKPFLNNIKYVEYIFIYSFISCTKVPLFSIQFRRTLMVIVACYSYFSCTCLC